MGGVVHDLNNLPMAVLGSLEIAARALRGTGRGRTDRHTIQGAIRDASLTRRLLAFRTRLGKQDGRASAAYCQAQPLRSQHLILCCFPTRFQSKPAREAFGTDSVRRTRRSSPPKR